MHRVKFRWKHNKYQKEKYFLTLLQLFINICSSRHQLIEVFLNCMNMSKIGRNIKILALKVSQPKSHIINTRGVFCV
uniref:Putative ovule protein n=1 Tax=Solanum chacoense TaxID=4108 RepID=A0A0V0HG58_SOLCH